MPDILASTGIGGAFGIANNLLSQAFADVNARRNFKYNEMAADAADRRTRALYSDLYSPQALMEQYKKTGLSPSLMAAQGGGVGAGQSGAQGHGAHGNNADFIPIDPLTQAQIENIKADTKLKNNEAGTKDSEIILNLAQAGHHKAATALTESQTKGQELTNYLTEKTNDFNISIARSKAEEANYTAQKAMYEAISAGYEALYDKETINIRIDNAFQQNKNLVKDLLVKTSQIKYNEANAQEVANNVSMFIKEMQLKWAQTDLEKIKTDIQQQQANSYDKYVNNLDDLYSAIEDKIRKEIWRIEELTPLEKKNLISTIVNTSIQTVIDWRRTDIEGVKAVADIVGTVGKLPSAPKAVQGFK